MTNTVTMPKPLSPTDILRNRLYDASEVADMLGMSPGWVRSHAGTVNGKSRKQPKLVGIKMGERRSRSNWKFLESDIATFIEKLRNGS